MLCVGGVSSQSHAGAVRGAKQNKVKQHNKVKAIKAKRRTVRKAKPQRRLAILRGKTATAKVLSIKVRSALRSGNMNSLMSGKPGNRVLKLGKFSATDRAGIIKQLDGAVTPEAFKISFGSMPAAERIATAKSVFMATRPVQGGNPFTKSQVHPLTAAAWNAAGTASGMSVRLNQLTFKAGKTTVTYTNTPVGITRATQVGNGKVLKEGVRRNRETGAETIQPI